MFLTVLAVSIVCVSGRDLLEPKFQVLSPNELMVKVPHYGQLVTFRIGVKRENSPVEDVEKGENHINNNRIFIYDDRLQLKKEDVINYLIAFRDDNVGYQARTGRYVFDGVYLKNPSNRRRRRRRELSSTTTESPDDSEEFNPTESRFGGQRHHGHGHGWHHGWNHGYQDGFRHGPPFNPFVGGPPSFRNHGHPPFHNHHGSSFDCNCDEKQSAQMPSTRKPATTSAEFPDIDIRFSND